MSRKKKKRKKRKLKPRNPYAVAGRLKTGAGVHANKKKQRDKKKCRGRYRA